jgi:hypothetical protein
MRNRNPGITGFIRRLRVVEFSGDQHQIWLDDVHIGEDDIILGIEDLFN